MVLFPDDIYEKLEFDKIIDLAKSYCRGQRAKDILGRAQLFNSKKKIESLLTEVSQLKTLFSEGERLPLRAYEQIDEDLFWMRKINFIPELDSIHRVYNQIWSIFELVQYFSNQVNVDRAPKIASILEQVEFDPNLIKKYNKIFDEEGLIKPDASPELKSIHKGIDGKKRELDRTFNSLADKFSKDGMLKDNKESFRAGRRVLSVPAEYKRKIKGIIHDESSTGRTVFIEPEQVLNINNDIFELEAKKRHEERKIINELVTYLRPYVEDFELWQRILVRLDIISAKANLAMLYDGAMPKLRNDQTIILKNARHPLLQIINAELHKKVVPFNLILNPEERILVISGPNAGGKSVTMKSVGLIYLMLQSGLLVPVHPDSELGLFKKIMVDIGDQQSLEDDLSTYSSRLENMRFFLENSTPTTLFLIDEFGSGTDPKLGGAIAESILDGLKKRKAFGVITTHYSNLKMYAFKNDGLINAAMEFDKQNIKPTYRLSVGKPGSSFAFEIAKNAGLPKQILHYAKNQTGVSAKAVEQLLVELQEEKRVFEKKLKENQNEKEKLQRLINTYESAFGDLEVNRKKVKIEKKKIKLQEAGTLSLELKELIKELKQGKKLEEAEKLASELREKQFSQLKEIETIEDEINIHEGFDPNNFKVGDFVKMKSGDQEAEILSIEKGKATLAMGVLKISTPLKELIPANVPIEINKRKSVISKTIANPFNLDSKLDVREYRMEDTMHFLQEFLDTALMSNMPRLKIIHGKGSGVKRKAVLQKLKEYKDVKRVWHPEENDGGNGVTYVDF